MPNQSSDLVFYYNPFSRASTVLVMMEELGIPFELKLINFKTQDEYKPEFTAINPMSKIPTIVHKGVVITEQPAVFQYLADEFSYGTLSPKIGTPARGSYLRWLAFYGSSFEPAMADKSAKREASPAVASPFGSVDLVVKTINDQLKNLKFIAGDTFTAADVLWGGGLEWITMFKLLDKTPEIAAYLDRVTSRPSFARAREKGNTIAKEMGLM